LCTIRWACGLLETYWSYFQCVVHLLPQVIDIGSGRGYLGCHLSLMYHIPVVGVDSSLSNTGSAAERTRLLRKHWRGLVSVVRTVHWCILFLCDICVESLDFCHLLLLQFRKTVKNYIVHMQCTVRLTALNHFTVAGITARLSHAVDLFVILLSHIART